MDLKSGSLLGSYTILKKLGEGGMAFVYLAEHSRLGRLVAIKVLREGYEGNADAVQRFFLEARAVNQMRHPHIVDIIDFQSNEGGHAYYVMEFLEGMDVEQLLAKDQMTLPRALEIARQTASALDAVHDAGIVHRDLKSGNVFVTTDADGNDWVKLLDFGIAKLDDPHGRRIGDSLEGIAVGTPEYMSPEQATAKDLDHRADIYSFGVMLYQMVTGVVPLRGDSPNDTVRQHLYQKPRAPKKLSPYRLPKALNDLIMNCLAKKPDSRPQSMKEIQPELALIAEVVRYESMLRSRRMWQVAFAASTIGALFLGSMITDAASGRTPGATTASIVRGGGRLVERLRGIDPVPVAVAAPLPPQPASQPAVVGVAGVFAASAPTTTGAFTQLAPAPVPEPAHVSVERTDTKLDKNGKTLKKKRGR